MQINIKIADIVCGIDFNRTFFRRFTSRYKGFLTGVSEKTFLNLELELITPNRNNIKDDFVKLDKIDSRIDIYKKDFQGFLDLGKKQGRFSVFKNVYSFNSFLRVLYSILLLGQGGFLIHASGDVDSNFAQIFIGPSGSGKSTLIKKRQNRILLNDELISVRRKEDGEWRAFPTPFWGSYIPSGDETISYNMGFEIDKVYFLTSGISKTKRRLTDRQGFIGLMQNILNFSNFQKDIDILMGLVFDFSKNIRAYYLNPFEKNFRP